VRVYVPAHDKTHKHARTPPHKNAHTISSRRARTQHRARTRWRCCRKKTRRWFSSRPRRSHSVRTARGLFGWRAPPVSTVVVACRTFHRSRTRTDPQCTDVTVTPLVMYLHVPLIIIMPVFNVSVARFTDTQGQCRLSSMLRSHCSLFTHRTDLRHSDITTNNNGDIHACFLC
jgi:hypothetical protein